jgi:hypothetical protein
MEGADINRRKPSHAAWSLACHPKVQGGLGILYLSIHNESLLLKNLHKIFNRMDIPLVNLYAIIITTGQEKSPRKAGSVHFGGKTF